jgi:uncharacterized membrane protein
MDERTARARSRTSHLMALITCAFIIGIAVIKFLEPMSYPAGDMRNSILFRLAVYGLALVFALFGMVSSARWLLADRRR